MNKGVSYIFLCPLSCVNGELGTLLCVCGGRGFLYLAMDFHLFNLFLKMSKFLNYLFEMSKFKEITLEKNTKKGENSQGPIHPLENMYPITGNISLSYNLVQKEAIKNVVNVSLC